MIHMGLRLTRGAAAAVIAVTCLFASVAAPVASAAPVPGTECANPGSTSPDGTLTCDGLREEWLHVGAPVREPGQPCDRLGDVTASDHEGTVTCRQASSGLTWQR
jgi:hypothetical protein